MYKYFYKIYIKKYHLTPILVVLPLYINNCTLSTKIDLTCNDINTNIINKSHKTDIKHGIRAHATGRFRRRSHIVKVDFAFSLVKSEFQVSVKVGLTIFLLQKVIILSVVNMIQYFLKL